VPSSQLKLHERELIRYEESGDQPMLAGFHCACSVSNMLTSVLLPCAGRLRLCVEDMVWDLPCSLAGFARLLTRGGAPIVGAQLRPDLVGTEREREGRAGGSEAGAMLVELLERQYLLPVDDDLDDMYDEVSDGMDDFYDT
jgi:hypothetical protein